MLRILAVLVPALCGAALVWFLAPASGGAGSGADAGNRSPVESRLSEAEKKAFSVAVHALIGSPRDVFGKPLKIITPDNQLTREDLVAADAKFLAKAYVECQVVLSPELYRQYLESIGQAQDGEASQADETQMNICAVLVGVFNDVLRDES